MDFMKLDIQLFASGTISLGTNGYLTGQIVWSSTSNGTAANSSNVTATLQLRRTNSYTTTGTWTGNLSINGNSASYSYYGGISSSWVTVSSRTVTVAHNADGSKTCTISGSGTGPSGTSLAGKTVSNSANVTLDKIPRQATIKSAPDFNDEANPTITYSNPAGNSVASLMACIANSNGSAIYASYRDISKTGTSYTFNLTEAERENLRQATPNSNSLSVRFYVRTIISGTTYYSYINKTLTIVNANPIFTNFDFNDINSTTLALTGNSKKIITNYSDVQVSIDTTNKAEAQKDASIIKYRFTNDNQNIDINYSDSATVTGTINKVIDGTNNVYAIDSRNNSTLVTKLASEVIKYEPIYIDKQLSSVTRNNSNVGTGAILNLEGTFWNDNFGQVQNSIQSVTYKFKKTGEGIWLNGTTQLTLTITDNSFSFNGLIASNNPDTSWDLESSYNVKIIISDKLSINEVDLILNSAIPTLSLDKNGVGIMCAYDSSIGGKLQIGGQRALAGDVITATLSNQITVPSMTRTLLPFSNYRSTSNSLILNNGAIEINDDATYILISGACSINKQSGNLDELNVDILVDSMTACSAYKISAGGLYNDTCVIAPIIVRASRGSTIQMDLYTLEGCKAVSYTYLTVQILK